MYDHKEEKQKVPKQYKVPKIQIDPPMQCKGPSHQ